MLAVVFPSDPVQIVLQQQLAHQYHNAAQQLMQRSQQANQVGQTAQAAQYQQQAQVRGHIVSFLPLFFLNLHLIPVFPLVTEIGSIPSRTATRHGCHSAVPATPASTAIGCKLGNHCVSASTSFCDHIMTFFWNLHPSFYLLTSQAETPAEAPSTAATTEPSEPQVPSVPSVCWDPDFSRMSIWNFDMEAAEVPSIYLTNPQAESVEPTQPTEQAPVTTPQEPQVPQVPQQPVVQASEVPQVPQVPQVPEVPKEEVKEEIKVETNEEVKEEVKEEMNEEAKEEVKEEVAAEQPAGEPVQVCSS